MELLGLPVLRICDAKAAEREPLAGVVVVELVAVDVALMSLTALGGGGGLRVTGEGFALDAPMGLLLLLEALLGELLAVVTVLLALVIDFPSAGEVALSPPTLSLEPVAFLICRMRIKLRMLELDCRFVVGELLLDSPSDFRGDAD